MTYPGAITTFTAKTDNVDNVLAAHMNAVQTDITAIETELGTDPAGTVTDVKTRLAAVLTGAGLLQFAAATTLTIATGSITTTQNWHRIDTEAAAATDDLDTITASSEARLLFVRSVSGARNVVIKHNTGNIYCANGLDIILDNNFDLAVLIYDATLVYWIAFGMSSAVLPNDGWINPGETWTYASATTFTISGDFTSKYSVGDKIKLTQTTVKYFYITAVSYSSPNTTVTISGGTDYTLANAAITVNRYSKITTPNGFPQSFNWNPYATSTPTSHGFSALPSGGVYRYTVIGKMCTVFVSEFYTGTSNGTGFTMDAPLTSATVTGMQWGGHCHYAINNSAVIEGAIAQIASNSGTITLSTNSAGTAWTNSGTKCVRFEFIYELP